MEPASFCHDTGQKVNNSLFLLKKLCQLLENSDLSDIQIGVGHKIFYAHKLILCASSDVFKVMLMSETWPESQRNKIILKEEPECIAVFDDFLKYLYTGEVQLNHYNVLALLMLSDKYNVCDLRDVCISYMCDHVVSLVEHNHAVSWLQYAQLCGHDKIAEVCYNFILWNFHKVACTHDFLLMDKDLLLEFLESSDLVIVDELTLFRCCIRWLQHQQIQLGYNEHLLRKLVLEVLSQIRFPMMTLAQLQTVENDPMATILPEFFRNRIHLSIQYHQSSVEGHKDLASISGESTQFHPRNYTNDIWSTTLNIDNYAQLPLYEVRPLYFSSPVSGATVDDHRCLEWNVDLFPKGVQFQRCIMIGLWRNLEVNGATYNTVRMTLTSKTGGRRKVEVVVLVRGVQDRVEYIRNVVSRYCFFEQESNMVNLDEIVPLEELNHPNSGYLGGMEGDAFQVNIIIKPQ